MKKVIIDNRYKILKKCGTGATGTVYKVRDLKDKRIIALKMLSKKKTSSEAVQRFKREFKLLAGLRHPNLCSVYDFGILKDGQSYFTMEYIDGPNIFEFTKKLPHPVRKDIANGVYPLIVQFCRVLEYIHSKGLIHYDIKPGNVLIAKGKEQGAESKKPYALNPVSCVKLMDFGLAAEARIKGGTTIKGTFPYIAPELIKGLAVDHRADLYSLGVLLYEIFTRKSFQSDGEASFATLLKQREEQVTERPSKIVSDIPKVLERLIVRLLALEPAARFGRANEVIKEINKISRLKFEFETEETLESYLLSSRFVGREKEMRVLKSLYERARQGKGKVVLVTGDAGIGKSRLLKEFRIFTQLKRSHSFIGHAYKDKTQALEPFSDIFRELINYFKDITTLSREIRLSLAVLFKIFPGLTDGRLKRNLPKLAPLEPKQEKLRTFEALSELMKYCASSLGELVILLEDLHWADDLSIQFLEYLARNLEGKNIIICGTSRKEELEENRVLRAMVSNLKNEGYFDQIELTPLKFRSLYSFLDSTITHGSNSPELVRYLMKKTGGNPFFVEEIMRTLLRTKKVSIGTKMETKDLKQIAIPGTIEDVVLKRIKDLDHTSQKVMKFAAILLRSFSYDLMKGLAGLDDTELSNALWELKRRQVLVEEDNEYRFYHATLREAINKRMAYREKRKLYYQTGKTLELIYKRNIEGVVEDLAYYFISAKDSRKGIKYGLRAAKKSSERYANEQAIRFYKGVLHLLSYKNLKLYFDVLQKVGYLEDLSGHFDKAVRYYKRAFGLKVGTIDQKIGIYIKIASLYALHGEYNRELLFYRRAIRFLKKSKPCKLRTLMESYIHVKICRAYLEMGDYKSVEEFKFDKLKFPKEVLKVREMTRWQGGLYINLGTIEYFKAKHGRGDYDKAIYYYKQALKYTRRLRHDVGISIISQNLGASYSSKYDYQNALNFYQKAKQLSEKIGLQHTTLLVDYNLASLLKIKGYYVEAVNKFQKCFSIAEKFRNPVLMGYSVSEIGECSLILCDYQKSKECLERGLDIFHTIGWQSEGPFPLKDIGGIYKALGDYTLALKFYRKALKITTEIKNQNKIAESLIGVSSIFIDMGKFVEAKVYLNRALKIAKAYKLKDSIIDCHIISCRYSILVKNYTFAAVYCERGIKLATELGVKRKLVRLLLYRSEIYCRKEQYVRGIKVANRAIKLTKAMETKDLYAEALLIKVKNEIRAGLLSKLEIIKYLDEARKIAEEIGCPEVLWKIYFEYGRFLQNDKQYLRAVEYYQRCHDIFEDVGGKIKNESYQNSYLDRPDRQAVFTAIDEIKELVRLG